VTARDPEQLRRDLAPGLEPAEAERMLELAARLAADRPLPPPAFRGDLRRRLATTREAGAVAPRRVRALAALCALSGLVLLAIAAGGVAGGGPFAA
jgi:hypothetical protein